MELPVDRADIKRALGICIKIIIVCLCVFCLFLFLFFLVKTTEIDWHNRKCCNFCITNQWNNNSNSWEIRRDLHDENCIVRCGAMEIQLTSWTTRQIHSKWYSINANKVKHTTRCEHLQTKKTTIWHVFIGQREEFHTINNLRFRNYSSLHQSNCCVFQLFFSCIAKAQTHTHKNQCSAFRVKRGCAIWFIYSLQSEIIPNKRANA